MKDADFVVCLLSILMMPLATAGVALIQGGLGRSRSAAHAMLSSLCVFGVAALSYVLVGHAWVGASDQPFHAVKLGGLAWNWLGNAPSVAAHWSTAEGGPGEVLCFHLFAAGLAASLALGTGSDRWRLAAICACTALFSIFIYPLFAHWTWGGGWLGSPPAKLGLPPLLDVGGAGTMQTTGGLLALSVAWILRPRRGKYLQNGITAAIPGHNIMLALFGCFLAFAGWTGMEIAASVLFRHATLAETPLIVVNSSLAAGGGALVSVAVTQARFGKTDASLSANGWIAGLVAGSAACGAVAPLAALFTGAVAGAFVPFLVELLEVRLLVDDPGGTVSVHAAAGLWGLLAAGIFGPAGAEGRGNHLLMQMIGVATLLGVVLPMLHGMNLLLNRLIPFRVDRDGEWHGMDIRELGAGAYPEFVRHADELGSR